MFMDVVYDDCSARRSKTNISLVPRAVARKSEVISKHNQELGMENPPPWLRCPMTTLGNYFQKTKYT